MTSTTIKAFNALPRDPLAPSGQIPNNWHFDLRYIHFEPNPSHVLFLVQPDSRFVHMEPLPIGVGGVSAGGIQFFPENAAEAAAEIARAIIHSFVDNLGQNKMMENDAPAAFAPWRLTTEPKSLAIEVAKEFKRLGVHEGLCRIQVPPAAVLKIAQEEFTGLFNTIKQSLGIEGLASAAISTPTAITFSTLDPEVHREDDMQRVLQYARDLDCSKPPINKDNRDLMALANAASQHLAKKSFMEAKAEADSGSPESMMDIAMRLKYFLGCVPNRFLERSYLINVILSPRASDAVKSTAHALLIDWYITAFKNEVRSRYLFAACHHANQAIILGRAAARSKAKSFAAPTILRFLFYTFERLSEKAPELFYWYKQAVNELQARKQEIEKEKKVVEVKRVKHPNRYRCAAVGCGIESTTGKVLKSCSGPCDADVKPHYCSRECQKADWKNHKPFCKPGAPCSVIDADYSQITPALHPGAVHIPIKNQDGSSFGISSSTLDRTTLKEMRDLIEADGGAGVFSGRSIQVDIGKIE